MKFDLKSMAVGVIIGAFGFTTVYAASSGKMIEIFYNVKNISVQDKEIVFEKGNEPFIYNNTTYVPLRTIAESLDSEISYFDSEKQISIYSKDKAKIRLLLESVENFGADSPEKAIELWAKGVKSRNAALQYSIMTKELKEKYIQQLDENGFNFWVTGVSSPWVENYEILKTTELSKDAFAYELKFNTKTSEGDYNFSVKLNLVKEDDFWRISEISGDDDSSAYTGLQ